ncbi:outer membrane porin, OprD family [Salmonella enterica subsp. diarizonae]|uniref:Outer membrane porin, OprD family n=3 Tax=Salmonella enterica TaxID=28901 RepID=A0A7Z1PCQ0_SALET|nr:outer membrane porin, OprD family [Salmonella enterica]EAB9741989.1 outer membrane porin, OprD family [Salmonella enterica subsp. diarizonae]EDS4951508.1 OprD family porin [Salmonella enterica subsp. enterica serovar Redlands]EDT6985001.1 OprD family porin [Salmonella enterica subsp. arizonae]PTU34271.1 outer membrane porin, OprD family [Salmonella enterica subsp. enterica]
MPCRRRTAISTLNSNVSIGSSLKTASFTHGGSVLHWHVGHFYIGTNIFVSGQSESKGFISDSKLDVLVRSYYFNSNKKDGGVDNRDWSGAIQGNYSSGFTWGTVGKPLFCGAF